MAPSDNPRLRTIADAAITVLARSGLRGLTHRAVDEAAALPPGSTSYYFRTRAALLDATVARLAELDLAPAEQLPAGSAPEGAVPTPDSPAEVAGLLAAMLNDSLTRHRDRTLARYELSLEATRRPALRATLDQAGLSFRRLAAMMLAGLGSAAPERHARMLIAYCDGMLFDSIAGAGQAAPPSAEELRTGLTELLTGILQPSP